MSHMGSACLTCLSWAVCVSHGQCVSDVGSVCLTWTVCISCLPWAVCVSHMSHVGSVCLTWALCVSHGQPTVWAIQVGGWATQVGTQSAVTSPVGRCVSMSGRQMEGCVGLSTWTYSQLS